MSNILIDTKRLNELLQKAEDTGLIAWEIGQKAKGIKEVKSYENLSSKKYKKFEDYCSKELNKSEATIVGYIKIFEAFEKPEDIATMLVTHLRELVKIKDKQVRATAVKIFKRQQREAVFGKVAPQTSPFSTKEIKAVVKLLQVEGKITENEVEQTIQVVLETKRKEDNRKSYNRFGETFGEIKINELKETILREPIDEQGTVAIFCILFQQLKNQEFDFVVEESNRKIQFHQIDFVRVKFPDCRLIVKNNSSRKKELFEIMVEFEYESGNYITPHNHIISNEICHLIICWKNNIDRDKYSENQNRKIPPIISLENFVKFGKIELK